MKVAAMATKGKVALGMRWILVVFSFGFTNVEASTVQHKLPASSSSSVEWAIAARRIWRRLSLVRSPLIATPSIDTGSIGARSGLDMNGSLKRPFLL